MDGFIKEAVSLHLGLDGRRAHQIVFHIFGFAHLGTELFAKAFDDLFHVRLVGDTLRYLLLYMAEWHHGRMSEAQQQDDRAHGHSHAASRIMGVELHGIPWRLRECPIAAAFAHRLQAHYPPPHHTHNHKGNTTR